MYLRELTSISIDEGATSIYGRKGNQSTRKYRCSSGPRKGRIVAKMSTCHAPIDAQKKKTMTVTRSKAPKLAAKKSMFTKRGSGVSRAVLSKNRAKAPKRAKVQKRKR